MALFALTRIKFNGQVQAISVQDIIVVKKENGHRKFEPFKPTSVTDFEVSTRHKYAVLKTDPDGTTRRWYAMIGRLGESPEEVLAEAEHHIWPGPISKKLKTNSQPAYHSSEQMFLRKEKTSDPKPTSEPECKPASFKSLNKTTEEASQHQEFKGAQIQRNSVNKGKLDDLLDAVMNRLSDVCNLIVQRLDAVEQSVSCLPEQMKTHCMSNVREWLNSIPDPLPAILGASDVKAEQIKSKRVHLAGEGGEGPDRQDGCTSSDGDADDNYGDADDNYVDAGSGDHQFNVEGNLKQEGSQSESDLASDESDSAEREMFYSFLSGVVS